MNMNKAVVLALVLLLAVQSSLGFIQTINVVDTVVGYSNDLSAGAVVDAWRGDAKNLSNNISGIQGGSCVYVTRGTSTSCYQFLIDLNKNVINYSCHFDGTTAGSCSVLGGAGKYKYATGDGAFSFDPGMSPDPADDRWVYTLNIKCDGCPST